MPSPSHAGYDDSIVTGRPAAVCSSAVMADQPAVGTAAAGE